MIKHQQHPGVIVREVDKNGPAARAGLRDGDYIIAVNGQPLQPRSGLPPISDIANLLVVRGEQQLLIGLTPPPPLPRSG